MVATIRNQLANHIGDRLLFMARFDHPGRHVRRGHKTLCFRDVSFDGGMIDHIWLDTNPDFEAYYLRFGDVVEFTAEVTCYRKWMHTGYEWAYGLFDVRDVHLLS